MSIASKPTINHHFGQSQHGITTNRTTNWFAWWPKSWASIWESQWYKLSLSFCGTKGWAGESHCGSCKFDHGCVSHLQRFSFTTITQIIARLIDIFGHHCHRAGITESCLYILADILDHLDPWLARSVSGVEIPNTIVSRTWMSRHSTGHDRIWWNSMSNSQNGGEGSWWLTFLGCTNCTSKWLKALLLQAGRRWYQTIMLAVRLQPYRTWRSRLVWSVLLLPENLKLTDT